MPSMRAAILASVCVWQCGVAGWPVPVRAQRPTQEFAPQPQLARQTPPPLPAPQQAPLEPDALAALTDIGAIRALTPEAANSRRRAHIRGTITYINEREPAGMIVHDGKAGLFIHYFGDQLRQRLACQTPARRHLRRPMATRARYGFAPAIVAGRSQVGGARTAADSQTGAVRGASERRIRLRLHRDRRRRTARLAVGVRKDAVRRRGRGRRRGARVVLASRAGRPDAASSTRASGSAATPARSSTRRVRCAASRCSGAGHRKWTIETSAPDPWSLPVRAISSLYTHHAKEQSDRRVRLRGTVTATRVGQPVLVEDLTMHSRSRVVRHQIYVRDETSAALIETDQPFTLAPGDIVDVAGFPVVSSTKPRLQNAVMRRASGGEVPPPRTLTPRDAARRRARFRAGARRRRPADGSGRRPRGRSLVLRAGNTVFEASHDPTSTAVAQRALPSGTLVSVTGIYVVRIGSAARVPPAAAIARRRRACSRRRRGGRRGIRWCSAVFVADHADRRSDVGQDERQQARARSSGSIARSSPNAAASRASCTTRSNRGWRASSCSSVRSRSRSTRHPRTRGARWASRPKCCATA